MMRKSGSVLLLAALFLGGGTLLEIGRQRLLKMHQSADIQKDIYPLPRTELLPIFSLGYRQAAADLLFTSTLIQHGQHFQQKRKFSHAALYLEAMIALDKTFRRPYLFADTFITVKPQAINSEDAYAARRNLEKGMDALPTDQELWVVAGQFVTYVGPSMLSKEEGRQWRKDGAKMLAAACEMTSSNENLPFQCIAASATLSKSGESEAAIRMLEKTLAITDDPELRELALGQLKQLNNQVDATRASIIAERRQSIIEEYRAKRTPGLDRGTSLLVGASPPVASCIMAKLNDPECATEWAELLNGKAPNPLAQRSF